MVAGANRRFISTPGNEAALAASLATLADDAALRATIGEANRAHAEAHYDEAAMITAYRQTYRAAMGIADD